MHRVDVNLCLLLCAAAALCTAASLDDKPQTTKSGPAAQKHLHGYMGSLDYGGQPPSYETYEGRDFDFSTWPVDRREGAPAPLKLVHPGAVRPVRPAKPGTAGTAGSPAKPRQAETKPSQQGQSQSQSSGFGLFGTLLKIAAGATEVVGDAVGRVEVGVGKAVRKQVKTVSDWLFR
ncbi:uncharacterized protein LOC117646977 isoform X2 [Thrips palmi]|uniref:Uncharacterized protein LOC117646977 isoform X2 n=1 Tax=Thrips palmi TaxID=161013 RepID=A0A6P8ZPL1_THRPL|nr:uncharacterized protein LOC117646977 isoform X2 [Thrips palmi]